MKITFHKFIIFKVKNIIPIIAFIKNRNIINILLNLESNNNNIPILTSLMFARDTSLCTLVKFNLHFTFHNYTFINGKIRYKKGNQLALKYSNSIMVRKEHELVKRDLRKDDRVGRNP